MTRTVDPVAAEVPEEPDDPEVVVVDDAELLLQAARTRAATTTVPAATALDFRRQDMVPPRSALRFTSFPQSESDVALPNRCMIDLSLSRGSKPLNTKS
jgi:hypothetical protein